MGVRAEAAVGSRVQCTRRSKPAARTQEIARALTEHSLAKVVATSSSRTEMETIGRVFLQRRHAAVSLACLLAAGAILRAVSLWQRQGTARSKYQNTERLCERMLVS